MLEPNPYEPPLENHEITLRKRNRNDFAPGEIPLRHPIAFAQSARITTVLMAGAVSYLGINELKAHEYGAAAVCGVLGLLFLEGARIAHRALPDLRRKLHDYREEYFTRRETDYMKVQQSR